IGTPEEIVTQPANDYVRAFIEEVNLARVLKVGAIARQATPLVLGRDTTQTAREKMQRDRVRQMYVVDRRRQPVGILQQQDLQEVNERDNVDISRAIQTHFPQVKATVTLDRVFPLFQFGLPIAVINAEGTFAGVVEASDLLASLSQHGQHNS
ncbi:MAG: glycine/betaine ABC transporter ATP-binding protein, partial [Cyanobacteriota bacterium]|nr:glycine/betaine ABC transporter ATP-binding protein [Cyanobacteriota bacterium]